MAKIDFDKDMLSWMGKSPWFFPMPLTLITMVLTWPCAVLIHELNTDLAVATAVIFVVLAAFVYYVVARFMYYVLVEPELTSNRRKIIGVLDGYFSLLHVCAGLGMAIAVLSNPIDQHFSSIPPGTKGYNLYWTYMLSNFVLIFNTVGFTNIGVTTALGVLPVLITSITRTLYVAFGLGLILTSYKQKSDEIAINEPPPPVYRQRQFPRHAGHGPRERGNTLMIKNK